jgi:hypothetical protein
MVKTNWQMGDTVQPEDLNLMGQEINYNASVIEDHRLASVLDHPDGSVTTEKLADGAVTAAKVAADVATQAELDAHANTTSGAHGATSAAMPNRIVQRDSAGRFKAAAPAAADDVARKAEVDAALPKSGGEMTGDQIFVNGKGVYGKDTSGVTQLIGAINNSNQVLLGDADLDTNIRGATVKINGYTAWHAGNLIPNVNANANSIAQRDSEGNIRVSKRIYFSNDDYIEFDDSTDTFSFKDDGSTVAAQDSNISAGTIRLTSTSDVSETSTNHAFQIGPSDGANVRIDTNELMPLNNGVRSSFDINSIRTNIANTLLVDKEAQKATINGNEIWHLGNLPQTRVIHRHDTNTMSQSASITSWPMGISYMRTENYSWVAGLNGSVITVRVTNQTGFQIFIPTDDAYLFYIRSTAAGEWKPWRILGTYSGSGSPEGKVIAPPGAIYTRTDDNDTSSYRLYIKKSNWGNTGWTAIG